MAHLFPNECMLLKFFSFTFVKIEQNCIFILVLLNSADLPFHKNNTAKDEHDGIIQNTNQMKMTSALNSGSGCKG